MQIFVFVFLKKIKLKQKCLDLRRDRPYWAQEPGAGVMLLIHAFQDTKGWSPLSLYVVRNKLTGGAGYLRVGVCVGAWEGA